MPVSLIVRLSLLPLPLALAACDTRSPEPTSNSASSVDQAHWNSATAQQLRNAVARRVVHGLDRVPFDTESTSATPQGDAALTRTALRYAAALAHGVSNPEKLFATYTLGRNDPDLKSGLAQAIAQGKVGDWLESLAPQDQNYRNLSKAYQVLRNKGQPNAPDIPDIAKPVQPGQSDPRVPSIAQQLVASDYLSGRSDSGDRYDQAMAAAVRHMQADYGIKPDGTIGKDTLQILNLSDADRARAIAVAMERLRWLTRTPDATRIDVNLASARLTYWRDGKVADTRKVVVGDPDTETPQLESPIFRLVANPTWTVPESIQRKEIAGKGAAYLQRNHMIWKNGRIIQQSGPKNSLGLVKFDMKNEHQIYLHDTPAKQLFSEVQRQRSHGCIRVEDALGFAMLLARDEGVVDQWNAARQGGSEQFVPLPRQIPVRLLYQTVLFDQSGAPVVRTDAYGWNDRVSKVLGFSDAASVRLQASQSDVGP